MIIETVGLQKSFTRRAGRTTVTVDAVTGIDLGVKETEIYGFLGPNGAGKTTTMRMLTTLVTPTAGEGTVVGHDLRTEAALVRREIGYVQQTGGLWDSSTPREELVLQGRFHGASAVTARRRADEVMEQLGITEFAGRRCGTLSGGQRRRVEIGLGVVHSPTLLFLDEPSTGLDPQSRAALWDAIRSLRDGGVTVFLTTHYLDEADALCDRVSIVDHGTVVATGSPDELKHEVAGEVVSVTTAAADERLAVVSARLAEQDWVARTDVEGATVRLVVLRGDVALPAVVQEFGAAGVTITAIDLHRASLDDVFLDKTGRLLHEA